MASLSVDSTGVRTGSLLAACVAEHGSATHPYFGSPALLSGPEAARNLADAVHLLTALHGRHPGVIDHAATRTVDPAGRAWLVAAAQAAAQERALLTRLAVAAGPIPSTPGGGGSEAAIQAQRGALSTLAQSDRRGTALGAALAFASDWAPVRRVVVEAAAKRLGVEVAPNGLGDETRLRAIADEAGASERALLFGAQQLALQHRALWDLLEARAQARSA
ncbi:MAG TPA: hypothetical protein VMG08_17005 [Allosphingosinicella sp.]|nr:hypothetical protein [Allosphingosinicella sp.]